MARFWGQGGAVAGVEKVTDGQQHWSRCFGLSLHATTFCQVARFWDKAGRVLAYKRQTAVEAAKREALDRQLDFLVGQTQRYSSLLAKKLAAESERSRATADADGSKGAATAQVPCCCL